MQPSTKESRDATRLVEQSLLPQPLERSGSPTILSSEIASRKSSKSRWDSIPWKLEVLSWIGSLCFFLAIIIVLRIVNNRPSPDLEFGITPNAIVSLLATFAEALLAVPINSAIGQMKWLHALQKRPIDNFRAIDEATRGPIGSIQLLAHRKAGYLFHHPISCTSKFAFRKNPITDQ